MSFLDPSQPLHARVDERLRADPIVWLSSTRPDGRPHLVPVWFWWDGETVLIFTKPGDQKVRNLRHSPHVWLALETEDRGQRVAMFTGTAELLGEPTAEVVPPAYVAKYQALLDAMGWQVEGMTRDYSQPIRVTPVKLFAW